MAGKDRKRRCSYENQDQNSDTDKYFKNERQVSKPLLHLVFIVAGFSGMVNFLVSRLVSLTEQSTIATSLLKHSRLLYLDLSYQLDLNLLIS